MTGYQRKKKVVVAIVISANYKQLNMANTSAITCQMRAEPQERANRDDALN